MSFFDKMKKAKAAARDHKLRQAEKTRAEQMAPTAGYHHKPKHAALDAMAGAPASWKAYDQPAIFEAHRKRMSRPQSAATSMTAFTTPGRMTPSGSSGNIARATMPKSNSVGTDLTARSTAASTARNSARASMNGVNNPPRAQHWGYAAYAGLDPAQQADSRQSHMAGKRAVSYHGRSPLATEGESPFHPS